MPNADARRRARHREATPDDVPSLVELSTPLTFLGVRRTEDFDESTHWSCVLKLRPVTFVYKQDGQATRQYGLIAEEVATV